jgi:hypothetical protein
MILGTSRAVRVFAYPEAVDLRKGYDGLFGLVKQGLGRDPLSGDLFLFVNQQQRSVSKGMPSSSAIADHVRPSRRRPSAKAMTRSFAATGYRLPRPTSPRPSAWRNTIACVFVMTEREHGRNATS